MAEAHLHEVINGLHGKIGDVVFKKRGDKVYIARRPDFSKRKLSPGQKKSVARFREAVKYAQGILADPQARKPFERKAQKTGKTLYNTIIADYLGREK